MVAHDPAGDVSVDVEALPLIDLRRVSRGYRGEDGQLVHALDDVTLTIGPGEFVCLTGPSGSGKSTLLNIVGCLDRPTGGAYHFAGVEVSGLDANGRARLRRDSMGFVFQASHLLDRETARANVELPGAYRGLGRDERRRRADELLGMLGLAAKAEQSVSVLSGGERQRVVIARALMNGGRVILADEPTAALDAAQSEEVMSALAALAARGHTVVVASHDPSASLRAARTVALRDGRVVADSGADPSKGGSALSAMPPPTEPSFWHTVERAVRYGWRSLQARPLFTTLATLSVALGAWCVIATLSLAAGAYDETTAAMGRMGADEIYALGQWPEGNDLRLTPQDALAVGELPAVRHASIVAFATLVVRGAAGQAEPHVVATSGGFMPQFMHMEYTLASGRNISPADDAARSRVVVISSPLRDKLFGPGADAIGAPVWIANAMFTVQGVLAPHPIYSQAMYQERNQFDESIYASFSALRDVAGDAVGDQIGGPQIMAKAVHLSRVQEAVAAIRDLLIRRHGMDPDILHVVADNSFVDTYWAKVHNRLVLLGILAAVTFLSGGCAITAVMLTAARARAAEIALHMAVGARRRDVVWQFLTESSLIAAVGGVAGAALGYATGSILATVLETPINYDAWFLPAAVGCAVVVGLLCGIAPARRAAAVDPATVLADA